VGEILLPGEVLVALLDRHIDDIGDIAPLDPDSQRAGVETVAVALVAHLLGHIVALVLLLAEHLVGEFHDPRPHLGELVAFPCECDGLGGAVEDRFLLMLFEFAVGDICRDALRLAVAFEEVGVVAFVEAVHDLDRSLVDREVAVYHLAEIEGVTDTQTVAGGAGALVGVEREADGLERLEAELAVEAREVLGEVKVVLFETDLFGIEYLDLHLAIALCEGFLDILRDTVAALGADDETVDHHFDGVFLGLGEFDLLVEAHHHPIDHGADIPLVAEGFEHIGECPFLLLDERREDDDLGLVGEREHLLDDIARRHRGDRLAALVAVLRPHTGEEKPEVVVYLGDGADGGAGVLGGSLLVDGDGGGEPLDLVDIGLAHAPEELSGIARERLDIPSLPLGVEGRERQCTLAAAADTGDDDELVLGDLEVDVLEVVLSGSEELDGIVFHNFWVFPDGLA